MFAHLAESKARRDVYILKISNEVLDKIDQYKERNKYGFSIYKGVLILWDEDWDTRICSFIGNSLDHSYTDLLVAKESEGCLSLIWHGLIPYSYQKGMCVDVLNDSWQIIESILEEKLNFKKLE